LALPRAAVATPAFMPVATQGTVKAMWLEDVSALGYTLILGNAYHLHLRPGVDRVRAAGGLHRFINWPHNILTDSGGFQVFSLAHMRKIDADGVSFQSHLDGSHHRFTPAQVVENQLQLGSDVIMPLDVCAAADAGLAEATEALATTERWLDASVLYWRAQSATGLLFGIMQGHFSPALRERAAAQLVEHDLPGYAVGGLSVGESYAQLVEFLHLTLQLLPSDRPRYVMGVGSPDYAVEAVAAGADMFDCVYPTRIARNALALTRDGVLSLRNATAASSDDPIDASCACRVCAGTGHGYGRGYLRHLFNQKEIMAAVLTTYHNLAFMAALMGDMRVAIERGSFGQFRTSFLARYRAGR
jgi:queuine tRNA-ribosyltransferase